MQGAREAWRGGGMAGLYAGYGPSVLGEVIGSALGFATMEGGCRAFERVAGRKPAPHEKALVGSLSTLSTVLITMPLEVIQRRMQVRAARTDGPASLCAPSAPARSAGLRAQAPCAAFACSPLPHL
jgi:hypothetical protein